MTTEESKLSQVVWEVGNKENTVYFLKLLSCLRFRELTRNKLNTQLFPRRELLPQIICIQSMNRSWLEIKSECHVSHTTLRQ